MRPARIGCVNIGKTWPKARLPTHLFVVGARDIAGSASPSCAAVNSAFDAEFTGRDTNWSVGEEARRKSSSMVEAMQRLVRTPDRLLPVAAPMAEHRAAVGERSLVGPARAPGGVDARAVAAFRETASLLREGSRVPDLPGTSGVGTM